ncbi:MAG TPA: YceI family protein [Trebonia sp.]|jgi:polyisoprenoid-binding protein YceI|nr:YceI family protein [Trebonia sp.]
MAPSEQPTRPALQALLGDGALAGSWTLDPARSEVILHTRHTWGLRPLRGVFRQVSGHGAVTKDGDVSGVITVAAESVDTKNPQRDKHLRSADFFDIANHPEFTFTAEGVTATDGGVRVTGTLAIRGRTRPASFDATVSTADGEVTLDGEMKVNRTDYGMTWNFIGIAATDNTIAVHAVFTRQ